MHVIMFTQHQNTLISILFQTCAVKCKAPFFFSPLFILNDIVEHLLTLNEK